MTRISSLSVLLVVTLIAPAFAGCFSFFKEGDEGAPAPETIAPSDFDDGDDSSSTNPTDTTDDGASNTSTGTTNPPTTPPPSVPQPVPVARRPLVVIGLVDEGINPYHEQFRDTSDLAYVHPSEYVPGYPVTARRLDLSLNATSYDAARAFDADAWATVQPGELLWFPGTRIVGAISFSIPRSGPFTEGFGHGSMTAGRAAGRETSLAPDARIVAIQGLGGSSVVWAADQGWIDVLSNSWLSLVPPPINQNLKNLPSEVKEKIPGEVQWVFNESTTESFAYAQDKLVVIAASGNGAAYIGGVAPTPTYLLSTGAPGVILVGAHDNGQVSAWSGAPAAIVADGYGGLTVSATNMRDKTPSGVACCTSASAPYASGGAAAIILEARTILGDTSTGLRDGKLAIGKPGIVLAGPLADGDLTMAEFKALLFKTATPRPLIGPHDGLLHPTGRGEAPDATNPGGNPYCSGCWTLPVSYNELPEGTQVVALAGYGSIEPTSLGRALAVLRGLDDVPVRENEDAFFALDATIRSVIFADQLSRL